VAAEADQRDRTKHDEADRRTGERLQPLAWQAGPKHEERQREAGCDLDRYARDKRRRRCANARVRAGAQQQRRRKREQDQRVVMRAADREHEQHWV
jgi:hypothetical protein